ncbi:PREDICTED: centromere protein H [Elephantulus edwardii]|uniref:centromere protein H n=1 Tax=Elephantulus edwardii TaxID=28737 RepID=UPI0003F0978A|nr:PREDICTED: centromere protein H [Elephantulus edwardii]
MEQHPAESSAPERTDLRRDGGDEGTDPGRVGDKGMDPGGDADPGEDGDEGMESGGVGDEGMNPERDDGGDEGMNPERDDGGDEGGGQPEAAGALETSRNDHMALLLRLRAQTRQQLLEYKSMVDASEEITPEEILQEEQIEVKIESLENEIDEAKTALEIKNLALERIQLSGALTNHMENTNIKTSWLMDNMKHILTLNKSIMASQQESWDLEEKLLDIRKKRLQLKQASQSKFLEIQTEKNKQKKDMESMENSDRINAIQQELQAEIKVATVVQHVFQNIILGSKVNWAQDDALKEIVFQLEKNITML